MTNLFGPLPPAGPSPLSVEIRRGEAVESRHAVAAAICRPDGALVQSWGDAARPVYPRSAIKFLQALPLVETRAAAAFSLSDAELAIACASHNGEPVHVEAVRAWLRRLGLNADHLECGAHWPYRSHVVRGMAERGEQPTSLHNNCSGKHAGMLTTALHCGESVRGYVQRQHPVQRRIEAAMQEMCGIDLAAAPAGIDGCSIPTLAMPLTALATGLARFAAPEDLPPERAAACRRLAAAMAAAPVMVAGEGRFCTALIRASGGAVLVKTGAEGVFVAALPNQKLGVALKVQDGATRAAEIAIAAILDHLGALDPAARAAVTAVAPPGLHNWRGLATGSIGIAVI